jgi:protein involved in temperature-dependent protein secretion
MQDKTAKRQMVLAAAIQTIATACRHLYEEDLEAAKKRGDVMEIVRLKNAMGKDWEAWTAPIVAELDRLEKPPLIIEADAEA